MSGTRDIHLRRHTALRQRPDGSAYGDALGFDIVSDSGAYLSYHFDGAAFTVCGWYDPARYDGQVMIRGTSLAYYPAGSTAPEAVVDAGEPFMNSGIHDFGHHPATPAEAMARAALTAQALAQAFPGYQLSRYAISGWGDWAEADYVRIEEGYLTIKQTPWQAGAGLTSEMDMMSLPLSARLLERLKTEPVESLIDASGWGDTFLTEDAFDPSLVPVTDEVIHSDLQQHGLVLMTQSDEGTRRVQVVCEDAQGGYDVDVRTPPLPQNTSLDLFHEGDGELQIEWGDSTREGYVCYERTVDGIWRLSYAAQMTEMYPLVRFITDYRCGMNTMRNASASAT